MLKKTCGALAAVLVLSFGIAASTQAAELTEKDVPAPLRPWIPWVSAPDPQADCPVIDESFHCVWPGSLRLDLASTSGTFELRVRADAPSEQSLVGDTSIWPQDVRVDGEPAAVLSQDGLPSVRLDAGTHTISGELYWPELPEGLRIPESVAILSLSLENRNVEFPQRGDDGILWLQKQGAAETEDGDRLDLTVMRKISDGVPMRVETRLVIRVSGQSREVELPGPLLPRTQVLDIDSPLPARIGNEGALHLQLRPGTHTVTIHAHTDGEIPEAYPLTQRPAPWPKTETWVWEADEDLRQVTVSGAPGVDPSHTTLPDKWKSLPAFILTPGNALALKTTRRGEPTPPPDQLDLSRELWLDIDGTGYTVRDNIKGTLNQTWRLDLTAPGKLGHVAVSSEDRLITRRPGSEDKSEGVELRKGSLQMTAESRYEDARGTFPAVGWDHDVQQLSATLNLPPGWTLLFAGGVDNLSGTWWDDWNLFTFFFVLVVSLAIAKLTRVWIGAVALLALVLCHQQDDAPYFVWISLLLALGLLHVLPRGRLRNITKGWWWASVVWLVVVLVPFSVTQVRTGLFPQIEDEPSYGYVSFGKMAAVDALPPPPEVEASEDAVADEIVLQKQELKDKVEALGAAKNKRTEKAPQRKRKDEAWNELGRLSYGNAKLESKAGLRQQVQTLQQDPKAVVQTGPGVPKWNWKSWHLGWSGPVDADHQVTLYLVSPTVNLVISILRVLLLVLVSFFLVRHALCAMRTDPRDDGPSDTKAGAAAASAAGILALLLAPATSSAADFPPSDLLVELEKRMAKERPCTGECLSVSNMTVTARGDRLALECEVHAGAPAGFRLPGPMRNWVPDRIFIDGSATTDLALRPDDFIHVRIPHGVHTVRVEGRIPPTNAVTLELGDRPHRVEYDAPGFTIDGVRDDGTAESSILLARIQTSPNPADKDENPLFEESSYPPWLRVTRTFAIALPWTVHTVVERVSPPGSAVLVRVPLLEDESVVDADVRVEDEQAVVSFGRDDTRLEWMSTLAEKPSLALEAPGDAPWSEQWIFECSPIWQCDFEGLVPTHRKTKSIFRPVFDPWPGESMSASFVRPEGAPGQSTTIDVAELKIEPGSRLVNATLTLIVRSSRGGEQTITLPAEATVQELTVDGAQRPYRQKDRELELNLEPGGQRIEVEWQQTGGIETLYRAPEVSVGSAAANATVSVHLPSDRWLLWTGGPSWGPAVLFWGYLLTVLLAGLILGSIPSSPLRRWQWMLLALGLTQIPVAAAVIVVSWFLVLAWRAKAPPRHFVVHNGLQVVIAVWTIVAMVSLIVAVYKGLAVQPDMQVEGGDSTNTHLVWYTDRVEGTLPRPWVLSVPLLVWKLIMLAWSLWLAWSIVKWAPWAWRSVSEETLWRPAPPRKKRPAQKRAPAAPPTGEDPPPKS